MRTLYRLLLQLHPPAFRERYAAEMLWIFDQTEDGLETVRLLGDGVVSLLRQWTVRRVPGDAHSSRAAQAGAAPMFLVSARRPPAGRVLFSGALCSFLMFGAVGSVIARGGCQGFAVMPHAEAARSRPLSFLAMAALPQAATADEPGSISGLVIDGMTQQPLAGASVLVLGRGIRLEATTD
ncbi:MAG: hypothetical protein O3A53_03690 [Acidobacteria bacterium]|nr:hypothetical protein [Acidobacteriota bacterium]MDA1233884.1 hypothetical protein [Acidobacteriota bacterium]